MRSDMSSITLPHHQLSAT